MEQESLFTATKWALLKLLEENELSPLELANMTGYSLANVSQQLRLLEMAGLVTSYRVPNRDKGQPRILYKLAGNNCYIISAANDLVEKKRIIFSDRNKIQLKLWFLEDPEARSLFEKAFWRIEEHLDSVSKLAINPNSKSPVSFFILPKRDRLSIDEIQEITYKGSSFTATYSQLSSDEWGELKDSFYILHE